MSNLGVQSMYHRLNSLKDTVCERVFLPDLSLSSGEELISLENQRPLREFNILGFSVSYENDYLNILKILELANIPIESKNRTENDPLLIMGGACIGFNPEPLACFTDCFLIGEAEVTILEFIDQYIASQEKGDRKELLHNLATKSGFYVPSFYHIEYKTDGTLARVTSDENIAPTVSRSWINNLDAYQTTSRIMTDNTEFGNMFLIEISRGCFRHCHFCLMSGLYKPCRTRDLESLIPSIERGLNYRNTIGLISASATDHPRILPICSDILAKGGKVSISSLRLESITDEFLDCLTASGPKTITLAPEAGGERLRKEIGKNISDELILDRICQIAGHGIPNLKLYFMIGLPTETSSDIEAIESLVKRIKHVMLKIAQHKASLGKITVSINCFVPKPFSLFERYPMEEMTSLQAKLKFLFHRLNDIANVSVIHDLPKWAFIQGILARGDRRVGEMLLRVHLAGGNWKSVFKSLHLNPSFYACRQRDETELLPWDIFRKVK